MIAITTSNSTSVKAVLFLVVMSAPGIDEKILTLQLSRIENPQSTLFLEISVAYLAIWQTKPISGGNDYDLRV
jgi:hypothetical protein